MKKVRKIADKLKKYSFFDLNPNTDYYALLELKSNNEKLSDAVHILCESAKKTLVKFDADFKCKHQDYDSELNDKLIKLYVYSTPRRYKRSQLGKHFAALLEAERQNLKHKCVHGIEKDDKNVHFFSTGGKELGENGARDDHREISILIKRLAERA
ncbi:hypothetical protein NAK66_002466 [Klebsiella oxytoca]|nr:hypothetical protein [Klebsiella oxytoca]